MTEIDTINEKIYKVEKIIGSNYGIKFDDLTQGEIGLDQVMLNLVRCRIMAEGICRYVVLTEKIIKNEESLKAATLNVYVDKHLRSKCIVPGDKISNLSTIQGICNLAVHYQTGGPLDKKQAVICLDALDQVAQWFIERYNGVLFRNYGLDKKSALDTTGKQENELSLEEGVDKENGKLMSFIPEPITVIGREQELEELINAINKYKKVLVTGIGGIGKTALLNVLCNSDYCRQKYETIMYLSVGGDLLHTLSSDSQFRVAVSDLREKRKLLTDSLEYAIYKLDVLERYADEKTLVVIDNLDVTADVLHKRICSLKCDLVVATRYNTNELSFDFYEFQMGGIRLECNIHKLFELYYGKKLNETEYPSLDAILSDVRFHTMTIVLLAKQMRYLGKVPSDYQNKNQIRRERANYLTQIMTSCRNDTDVAEMYINLFNLFDASLLTVEEKRVMKTMCVIPLQGLQRHFYVELVGEECLGALEKLEEMGWAQNNTDKTVIMMHPLVRDVVEHELSIYVDDPDICLFISRFTEVLADSRSNDNEVNEKYKELALSIYYQFPMPSRSKYKDYLEISRLFRNLDYVDIALEIQDKVKGLFINGNGKHEDSVDEAEALMQIGYTYHAKGNYLEASREFEKAVSIYGDNYANSLAFLAQEYLVGDERDFDAIESLLKDSLLLRERFRKDTLAEASSCHMYAKALSAYQRDLEYALSLEKRAYKIHSAVRPGSGLVSSSAYILGWLYVQTANDKEDILYGIEKLEESKQIRLDFSSSSTYWWMEDIYLKLGMAYEKYGDINKALEYYELLLEIRANKYGEDSSDKKMVEAYTLLLNAYKSNGDKENAKRCEKYLRYHS